MSNRYRTRLQRELCVQGAKRLIELGEEFKVILSKETLQLIVENYEFVVQPPKAPNQPKEELE